MNSKPSTLATRTRTAHMLRSTSVSARPPKRSCAAFLEILAKWTELVSSENLEHGAWAIMKRTVHNRLELENRAPGITIKEPIDQALIATRDKLRVSGSDSGLYATREAVVTSYAQAAVEVLGSDPADPEPAAARAFLAWLEPKPGTAPRWLVVLDDLADPADLRGLWPPASTHGRTLVTTRRRDAVLTGPGRQLVQVGLFTEDEANSYLITFLAAHGRNEPADQLAGLADDLGYLPLALSQAAAYLFDVGLDCVTYRHRLADRSRTLIDVLPDPSGLPDDQAATVAAAWSLASGTPQISVQLSLQPDPAKQAGALPP
ncbi:hypothetical protein ABZY09_42975 [Streptomyces sp. NPDC002928]|uniref:hypothetical protein n=1 Tax=Streptomyces sp. NPDC002928 TaxID=3154440 RepID=UPI00339FC2F7